MATNVPDASLRALDEIDEVADLYEKSMAVMTALRSDSINAETGRKDGPKFAISKAAALVGRTASAIREAEKEGRLPARERKENGRRESYSLADLNQMREIFGTRPWRSPEDPATILACQNFKGGVGKSTIAVHLAQYLAIHGYRVCLIDCDSQASSTMMFGYVPDVDLTEEDTLYGYLHDESGQGLRSRVRPTHFDGLSLVPANLKLYNLEYEIAAYLAQSQSFDIIDQISDAVQTIAQDFDVIIMDPPPALGMVSLGVMSAANALLVPMPPSIVDFSSTASFLDMLQTTMRSMEELHRRPAYNFIRMVGSRADDSKSMHREIIAMTSRLFGRSMLTSVLKDSAEIDNAISRLMTVYELEKPITSYEVHNRCLTHLNAVNREIELEIRRTWPSKAGEF